MAEASPPRSSGWLEDVAVGALSSGVNAPTATLGKAAFAALLLPQLFLLHVALRKGTAVGHVAALLAALPHLAAVHLDVDPPGVTASPDAGMIADLDRAAIVGSLLVAISHWDAFR